MPLARSPALRFNGQDWSVVNCRPAGLDPDGHQRRTLRVHALEGPDPGSTTTRSKGPFWPALFAEGLQRPSRQVAHRHRRPDSPGLGIPRSSGTGRPKHHGQWPGRTYYEKENCWPSTATEKGISGRLSGGQSRKWAVSTSRASSRTEQNVVHCGWAMAGIPAPPRLGSRHQGLLHDARSPSRPTLLGPWPGKHDYLKKNTDSPGGKTRTARSRPAQERRESGRRGGGKGAGFADWVRVVNE